MKSKFDQLFWKIVAIWTVLVLSVIANKLDAIHATLSR